jgi:histidinol phosphatase-like enzyme (inositol monophosphatase family)
MDYLNFLKLLAQESATAIKPYFANDSLTIEYKEDYSPVTEADQNAEQVMRMLIKQHFPDHGIIGEEFGNENTDAEYVWTLDPIDGTISFIHGVPLYGTLVALMHKNWPVLGMIHHPELNLLCIGDGKVTTINAKKVIMRKPDSISQASILATDIKSMISNNGNGGFTKLLAQGGLFRTWGDCFGYSKLVAGQADIMLDRHLKIWDSAALIPIVEGAGGKITSWTGGNPIAESSCIAAHPSIHHQVVQILNN